MRTVLKIAGGIVAGMIATAILAFVGLSAFGLAAIAMDNATRARALEAEVVELHKELSNYENRILRLESRADHMDDVTGHHYKRINCLANEPPEVWWLEC